MKLIRKILCLALAVLLSLALFSGCDNQNASPKGSKLQTGVKYYDAGDVKKGVEAQENVTYLLFNKDGTGEYYNYYSYESKNETRIREYTYEFKYIFLDDEKETLACFCNGVTYGENHNQEKDVSNSWENILTLSKNVLMTKGGTIFVNENYLKEIPNYGN